MLESGQLVGGRTRRICLPPVVDLEIPDTLNGSLLARLDGLGPAKSLAQVAAVLGRSFTLDLLAAVSGLDPERLAWLLDRVVSSGLLLRDGSSDGGEYMFKHALVQEAAYESLLRRSRRTIHERVARVLDAQIAAGARTAPEIVARHYEAAGLLAQAATHYQLAANLAAERSGHREAIAFLRRGIHLARQLPDLTEGRELEVEMQLALGSSIATRSYSDPELAVAYDRARELCEFLGNDTRVGQTLGGLSVFYINRGDIALGAELAERVLTIADGSDDDLLDVLGAVQLSLARSHQGRAQESLELAERALAIYHPRAPPGAGGSGRHRPGRGGPRVRRMEPPVARPPRPGSRPTARGGRPGRSRSAALSTGFTPWPSWLPVTGSAGRRPRPCTSPSRPVC